MPAARRRALLGRAIAFIPQAPMTALNPVLTIGAQFDEHLARLGANDRSGAARASAGHAAMPRGCRTPEDLLAQYPHQLSGGMCQRVLIALAFSSNPRLVVADEPTTALDVTMHPQILRLIADMQREHGTAVIFITHDLRLAAQLCDEVIVMYAGRAVESGPARAVLSSPAHPYTRCLQLANPSMSAVPARALCHAGTDAELAPATDDAGCHFAPRCPLVTEECRRAEPPNVTVAAGRNVACIRSAATRKHRNVTTGTPLRRQFQNGPCCRSKTCRKSYAIGGGLFGGGRIVTAVKGVSFTIAENEFVGLVGESGSGKSTIAKLLVGLEQPSSGRILLNGEDLTDPTTRSTALRAVSLQMVFQDPQSALNPRRRVASIVTQAMEAGSRHANWEERQCPDPGAACRGGDVGRFRRAIARAVVRAANASASTSRARFAIFRRSSSPMRSFPASMFRFRRSSSICWRGCAPSSASPCCSFRTTSPSCATCAAACW